jgi:hypothetical protein
MTGLKIVERTTGEALHLFSGLRETGSFAQSLQGRIYGVPEDK